MTTLDDESCPHCGSTDLTDDTPNGLSCCDCGIIVNEYYEEEQCDAQA